MAALPPASMVEGSGRLNQEVALPVYEKSWLPLEISSRMPLKFHQPPLPAGEARKVHVLAGYLPILNKTGLADSEKEGQGGYQVAGQQYLPHHRMTCPQTYIVIDRVGTCELAKHSPFISQIRELLSFFWLLYHWPKTSIALLSTPEPGCSCPDL